MKKALIERILELLEKATLDQLKVIERYVAKFLS